MAVFYFNTWGNILGDFCVFRATLINFYVEIIGILFSSFEISLYERFPSNELRLNQGIDVFTFLSCGMTASAQCMLLKADREVFHGRCITSCFAVS
jgi:hypothetical protein